ncbi:aminopeptidase [Microbulbifer bruguierae]|uniref:Aminopeptidase n=1 Tax=Microbulbifer bruguierae TaxID=3029061 RepID=A0ABY8NDM5_9GAMM|nr:aminopeptidase [Microbulbifer bruguierae]WGL15528.1 aminopeptidase [Microbulbifer bruguierae]
MENFPGNVLAKLKLVASAAFTLRWRATVPGRRVRLLMLLLAALLSGCESIYFYSQAASGQLKILAGRKSIDQLVADDTTDKKLRQQLQWVRAIRAYAGAELHLPVGSAYSEFTQLEGEYALWNLVAAPEFSFSPKRWCYPIAGCASYRGYFDKADAEAHGARLRAEGFDVYLGPVPAYSTLGWFDDPVLSSFVNWTPDRLAGLLFHELAHRRVYISGDTRFNESFATAVSRIALPDWRRRQGIAAPKVESVVQARRVNGLMVTARKQLQEIYQSSSSDEDKRERKAQTLERLRTCYREISAGWEEDRNFTKMIEKTNNATLALVSEYQSQVPAFVQLYNDSGSDWEAFYAAVEQLGAQSKEVRSERLQALNKRAQTSSKKVTGPSLQSDTCMSAAN